MGVSIVMGVPLKWMVYKGKYHYIKWMIWEYPYLFQETSIYGKLVMPISGDEHTCASYLDVDRVQGPDP